MGVILREIKLLEFLSESALHQRKYFRIDKNFKIVKI